MNCIKKTMWFILLISHCTTLYSSYLDNEKPLTYIQRRNKHSKEKKELLQHNRITYMLGEFAEDVVKINLGLVSWDSLKIFVTTAPFFAGARMID
ncbi:MAG TPA: hypothetical protein VKU36_02825, partial [Candidatus Babeliales bacterium]|nr:hypothetical protein [Candidatus Babeliales bacterium]